MENSGEEAGVAGGVALSALLGSHCIRQVTGDLHFRKISHQQLLVRLGGTKTLRREATCQPG